MPGAALAGQEDTIMPEQKPDPAKPQTTPEQEMRPYTGSKSPDDFDSDMEDDNEAARKAKPKT